MAVAAYATTVKLSGSSTVFSNEATIKLTANTVYQITDAAKRIINPSVAVVVEVDADGGGGGGYATAAADTYTIDYLFGKITFASDQGGSALVRISGQYLATVDYAEAREFQISETLENQDSSYFVSDGYKRKTPTLQTATINVTGLGLTNVDLDAGGGTVKISDLRANGTAFLIEIRPGGAGDYFRAWTLCESVDEKSSTSGLYEASASFVSAPVKGSGQTESALFGWGT